MLGGASAGNATFLNATLIGADLSGMTTDDASSGFPSFATANASRANFTGSNLANANFQGANLTQATVRSATVGGAGSFTNATLTSTYHTGNLPVAGGVQLTSGSFCSGNTNLDYAWWVSGNEAGFCDAVSFVGTRSSGANLVDDYLVAADFSASVHTDGNFFGASLQNANFAGADLQRSNFLNADMRGVDFSGANLTRARLMGINASSDFTGTKFTGATCPNGRPASETNNTCIGQWHNSY